MKIGFYGCGKLGLPCAEAIANKGHVVYGYDTALRTGSIVKWCTSPASLFHNAADIVFIAVPTPHDELYDGRAPTSHLPPKDFDYSIVKEVLGIAQRNAKPGQLVVLISTVLPGTIRNHFQKYIKDMDFVYNPYLIAMGTVAEDMVSPEMVIIGTEDGDRLMPNGNTPATRLIDFYETIMENNPRYEIGTWDEAEAIKIFYNTFISTKVALVNMIQDVAEASGNINCDVVTQALEKSTQRIVSSAYMKAGMGDGGACHPRDNIALRRMAERLELGYDLFGAVMDSREIQAKNMARALTEYKLPCVILGTAYKPGVEYEDGSASLLVSHYVSEFFERDVHHNKILEEPAVYLLAHPRDRFDDGADGSIVFDPWRQVESKHEVRYYGNTR